MDNEVHDVLGAYELLECIGRGGMASLFLARRAGARGFVRPVAVKVVHPHLLQDPDFVEMFIDEANVCSRIHHPNIVHVEELGEVDGQLFLVMEYVDGVSLQKVLRYTYLRKRPLPIPIAVNLMISVADGLHAAHETLGDLDEPLEIVHRDVSPANILLSEQGNVKIIDFGIAKSTSRQHHTRAKRLKGKVAYMSPEQVHNGVVDRRSDIYSLGVVMWEMLANRRAYRAKDEVTLLKNVIQRPIPPIDALRDDLPDELIQTLSQAVQRDVLARFETAHELRRALAAAVPEALHVTPQQIGQFVKHASAEAQSTPSRSVLRTATPTSSLPLSSGAIESLAVESASSAPETFNMSSTPDAPPRKRNRSYVVETLALACVLMAVVAGGMFFLGKKGSSPDPVAREAAIEPSVPAEAEVVEDPKRAELPPPAQAAPVEDPVEPVEAAPKVEQRSRTRSRRAAQRRRRRPRAAEAPKKFQDTTDGLASPDDIAASVNVGRKTRSKVDGVMLADEGDLDRATTNAGGKTGAKKVTQDDVVLAEEYQ